MWLLRIVSLCPPTWGIRVAVREVELTIYLSQSDLPQGCSSTIIIAAAVTRLSTAAAVAFVLLREVWSFNR